MFTRRYLMIAAVYAMAGGMLVFSAALADSHEVTELVAAMRPTKGNKARGTVTFAETKKGIRVTANITGLTPNGTHAIHVHQFGDVRSTDGTGTGGHYNPEGHEHGLPEKSMRHAGDLGNLTADENGRARYNITVENISLMGEKNPIIGRAVIIHEKADDGGQPVGNAGARISQGVIGIGNPEAGGKKK